MCECWGPFGHVFPGPSYDRQPCRCGEPFPTHEGDDDLSRLASYFDEGGEA